MQLGRSGEVGALAVPGISQTQEARNFWRMRAAQAVTALCAFPVCVRALTELKQRGPAPLQRGVSSCLCLSQAGWGVPADGARRMEGAGGEDAAAAPELESLWVS